MSPTKVVTFDATDADNDLDVSTVEVYIDEGTGETLAYNDAGGWQNGYAGALSAVTAISLGYQPKQI